jgi:glycosyltransferase involved in cell wall biosynthesis
MPSLCVFIPVKNGMPLLCDTIDSILCQFPDPDIEVTLCVCDGQSQDGTLAYLREVEKRCGQTRIGFHLLSQPDKGMYDGLSRGMSAIGLSHDIYCYINAGDYFSPYAFREVSLHVGRRCNWLTGLSVNYNERGVLTNATLPACYPRNLISQGFFGSILPFIQQESTFWSRALQSRLNTQTLSQYRYAGDFYLWHRFAQSDDLFILTAWLSGFRAHPGQLSTIRMKEYRKEFNSIRNRRDAISYTKAALIWLLLRFPPAVRIYFSASIIKI